MDSPCLNIIFDNRQPNDYDRLLQEFEQQGIHYYKFWEATVDKNSVVGSINASHKTIVRWAKESKMPEVCIAEQDLWFPADDGWGYFLSQKPKEYDLYLSATYIIPIENQKVCGFHLYFVSERFYDQFLSVPDESHIDTSVGDLKGKFVFCYPFAALQNPGFSANNRAVVNYNSILKEEDVYGKFR